MGLDVYLYRYEDYADTSRRESEYERESDAIWKRVCGDTKYERLTQAQKETARSESAAVAERLGLDEFGSDEHKKAAVQVNSVKYPEHLFKIGYFRSSYNDGGIDHVLGARVGMTLADLFDVGDRYELQPNWAEAKQRTVAALEQFKAANITRPYRACVVARNMFGGDTVAQSEAAALDIFNRVKGNQHSYGAFMSRDGDFWLDEPITVRAAIQGERYRQPCVYLVYDDNEANMHWYEQALEIVIETCDYVLAQAHPEQYWLHWSG